jgi:hypothetical protein
MVHTPFGQNAKFLRAIAGPKYSSLPLNLKCLRLRHNL